MRRLFLFVLSILPYLCQCQNLVPNPGFEEYYNCPTGYSCIAYSANYTLFPWVKQWANPVLNSTPDYFNICAQGTDAGVPRNLAGYQQPRTGKAYAGAYVFHNQDNKVYCEYISCKLTSPMQPGETYEVSFYVSNGMHHLATAAMARIGAHFSDTPVYNKFDKYLSVKSHVASPSNLLLKDSVGWTLISGLYTARGNEQYMVIGWFNDGTPVNIVQQTPLDYSGAYYYFDDVSVVHKNVEITSQKIVNCAYPPYTNQLIATAGNTGYAWNTGATTQIITATDTGMYWCTSQNGMVTHIDSFYIKDFKGVITDNRHFVLCNADSVRLESVNDALSYKWNTGATTEAIAAKSIGVYTCLAVKNCSLYVHNYTIARHKDTVTTIFDTTICTTGASSTIQLSSSINNAETYNWHNGLKGATININDIGTYWCNAVKDCILYADTFTYRPKRYADKATLGPDTAICYERGSTYTIGQQKQEGTKYVWSTGDIGCCINPQVTGAYILTITDGCTISADTVQLTVNDCDSCIYAPDAFTPNADGLNDTYRVFSNCLLSGFQILIANRYGQIVFESSDINDRWNGTFNGELSDLNTFYYMVRYKTLDNPKWLMKKGSVTLVH